MTDVPGHRPSGAEAPSQRPSHERTGRDRWAAPVDEPGTMRLFFAIPVPAEARARVGGLMEQVQAAVGNGTARIRWVRVDGLHLTLRFLGPTPAERLPALEEAADSVARADAPFDVGLDGGGAFPSIARPRTLWVGVTDGADRLAALADRLTRACLQDGQPLETRPFAPHLTIGRTDGLRQGPMAARALQEAAEGLRVAFRADRLILFRSLLGGGPARYEALHEARLGR
jgi:RNA 2',3'-cyclic 3'-phosphodiesterase